MFKVWQLCMGFGAKMINSPSKYTSLARLKQIQKDNFMGEGGQEYCPFEVETLINEKENFKAMLLTKLAEHTEFAQAEIESSDAAKWSRILTSERFFKDIKLAFFENDLLRKELAS